MTVTIEPLKHDDLETFVQVWWDSFAPLGANQVLPMIYPEGLTPALMNRLKDRITYETDGDLVEYCFVARDDDTQKIVGVSWWKKLVKPAPLSSDEDAKAELAEQIKQKNSGPSIPGMNVALGDAFYTALFEQERKHIQAKQIPYITLNVLGVLPEHSRKGVGSELLTAGLERVDDLNVTGFLIGSSHGRGLYVKHGYEVVEDFGVDATKYGGRSTGQHYVMIRPPQKK